MVQSAADAPRFTRLYSDEELLQIIPAVARLADPDWPHDVTAAEYNRALAVSEFAGSLSARGIQKRWKMTWPTVLAMVLDPNRNAAVTIRANAKKQQRASRLRLDEVAELLRLVADHLGSDALTAAQFDQHVGRLNAATRRSWLHAANRELLPTSADIDTAFRASARRGGWQIALEAAGLRPPQGLGRPRGTSWVDAIELFIDEVGVMPWSASAVREFMKQKQLSLAATENMSALRAQVTANWQASGRGTPPPAPPAGQRPKIEVQPAAAELGLPPRSWTIATTDRAELIGGLVVMYRHLHGRGEIWSQKRQRAMAGEDPSIPGPSFVQDWATRRAEPRTTAGALRAEAQANFQAELRAKNA